MPGFGQHFAHSIDSHVGCVVLICGYCDFSAERGWELYYFFVEAVTGLNMISCPVFFVHVRLCFSARYMLFLLRHFAPPALPSQWVWCACLLITIMPIVLTCCACMSLFMFVLLMVLRFSMCCVCFCVAGLLGMVYGAGLGQPHHAVRRTLRAQQFVVCPNHHSRLQAGRRYGQGRCGPQFDAGTSWASQE